MKYKIYFMRGDVKEIEANSAAEAYKKCVREYPETTSWDVLKMTDEGSKET